MSKKYKRNYLDNVVFRIDFSKIEDAKRLNVFLSKLDELFPYKEKKQGLLGMIKIDLVKDEILKDKENNPVWIYLDAYKNKKITVTYNFIAIEYLNRSYVNSKELLMDSKNIIDVFINDLSISVINRFGLRYINRFDLDTEIQGNIEWSKFFSKDLVGNVTFVKNIKLPIVRSMNNIHLRKEDHDILIRSGVWNQDFPSENTRKEFIIDIDAFSRFTIEDTSKISDLLTQYNNDIEKIFEKSINVEIKKLLNKKYV